MAGIIVFDYTAKDSSTGAPIASKFLTAGKGIANSYPAPTTDATSAIGGYAVGEMGITLSPPGNYQIPDPLAQANEPSWIRVVTTGGVENVTMPINPYDGMSVTITDIANDAGTHDITITGGLIPGGGGQTDAIENPASRGSFVGGGGQVLIITNSQSITWRFISGGNRPAQGKWKITATND